MLILIYPELLSNLTNYQFLTIISIVLFVLNLVIAHSERTVTMTDLTSQPSPWKPFFGFQITFPIHSSSLQAFLAEIVPKLSNISYDCKFDDEGKLLCSKRNGDPCAASIGLSPTEVYATIREALMALQLQPESPTWQPFQEPPRPRPCSVPSLGYQHIVAQFAALAKWCSERWEDGSIQPALRKWHRLSKKS